MCDMSHILFTFHNVKSIFLFFYLESLTILLPVGDDHTPNPMRSGVLTRFPSLRGLTPEHSHTGGM